MAQPAVVIAASEISPVVLYDGYCGLCDRSVRWLVEADRRSVLRYAPLQGETAAPVLERHGIPTGGDFDSFILVENLGRPDERLRQRSDGALAALVALGGWRAALGRVARLVPRILRDAVYDFIARRRVRWFGRLEACRIPTPEERRRFLP
jgi:predicted DCC family thiol-disulfide oxidoreductase YuxK